MTIAPELENAASVIKEGNKLGVRMSEGHTNATFEEAERGIDAGCTGATHLYNAMRGFEHREVGALGAALTDERVSCEIISDFVHSSNIAVKMAYKLKGKDNLIIISDTGNISGFPDGIYYELGRPVIVKNNQARTEHGNLCNSMLSVYGGAKNMLSLGVPLDEVAKMTSINPAKAIGAFREYGSIETGKYADFLLCDDKLNLKAVYIDGELVK